ncbi:PTS transporter subunit EIIB [Streptomyces sp. NPDC005811]|uniref:PTS transporter subunit EIIB n=1 Tax=Streptomyces sp. NPDC005811 TaxID=3154565 RepID=UPI0033E0C73B
MSAASDPSAESVESVAAAILRAVGGRENVTGLTHCFVRLRFRLSDPSAADLDALGAHPLVAFVVWQADELHVAPRRDLFALYALLRDTRGDTTAS